MKRVRWRGSRDEEQRDETPRDENHHHHRGDLHDLQGFVAALMHALSVLPPEIQHDQNTESRGENIGRQVDWMAYVPTRIFYESRQVTPRRDRTDWTGQHIIEQQR